MKNALVPVLGFAAFSGAGKTTLLSKLIPQLKKSGKRIALIKHSHHNFEIDKPGKDSYRLRKAGASQVLLVSDDKRAIISEFEHKTKPKLENQLLELDQSTLDLILVEGFKAERFPKIEIHRCSLKRQLIFPTDPDIIALATDAEIHLTHANTGLSTAEITNLSLPFLLDINHPDRIVQFILQYFSLPLKTT